MPGVTAVGSQGKVQVWGTNEDFMEAGLFEQSFRGENFLVRKQRELTGSSRMGMLCSRRARVT